jgi:hypothetical protein
MVEAFHEDLGTIFNLLLLVDLRVIFVMVLLCYSRQPSYLFGTMFPSLSILQHYAEFDIRTIVTLEIRSCCHATFFASSGRIGLCSIVQIIAPTFLGCWELIAFTRVICFQQDDHLILLDIVTHAKIGISLF